MITSLTAIAPLLPIPATIDSDAKSEVLSEITLSILLIEQPAQSVVENPVLAALIATGNPGLDNSILVLHSKSVLLGAENC